MAVRKAKASRSCSASTGVAKASSSIEKETKASEATSPSNVQIGPSETDEPQMFEDFDLYSFMEQAEQSIGAFQSQIDEMNRDFLTKIRKLESERFSNQKSVYESRNKVLVENHSGFWENLFLHHPELEVILQLESKSQEVADADLQCLTSLRGVEVDVRDDGKNYICEMTMHFDGENAFFENDKLVRRIIYPLNKVSEDDNANTNESPSASSSTTKIEVTELKPKEALKQLLGKLQSKEVDPIDQPFVCQFTTTDYPVMDQLIESMKGIYCDPVKSLRSALENPMQLDFPDSEDMDSEIDDEVDKIVEEDEDEDLSD